MILLNRKNLLILLYLLARQNKEMLAYVFNKKLKLHQQ